MKLINRTLLFLSAILFTTVSLWAILFYFQLLKQVRTTIDEGLANYKIVIIDKIKDDSSIVQQNNFNENNYIIKSINEKYAVQVLDSYKDTLVFSDLKQTRYRTRLLTSAFIASDGKFYELKVISQELDKTTLIKRIASSLLWLYLLMFIGMFAVNILVLKKTWKPFYRILNYLNDFRLDKGAYRKLTDSKIKEFSLLNESVQNLLKTNLDIYNNQKQFIENVSHELQTPLAIGVNKLELLAGEESTSPDQIQKIGEIITTLQRISGLNKSLLLLSKIENKQFIAVEKINFDNIFKKIIEDFSDFTDYQKIKISYHKEGDWNCKINTDLAETLIINLVKNAVVHNIPNGEIIINLSSSSFTIENTSDEPMIQENKLYKRFNKKSKNKSSTGLGLAIVKAITEASGLTIDYTYSKLHVFRVGQ